MRLSRLPESMDNAAPWEIFSTSNFQPDKIARTFHVERLHAAGKLCQRIERMKQKRFAEMIYNDKRHGRCRRVVRHVWPRLGELNN